MSKARAVGAADYRFFYTKKTKNSPHYPGNALSAANVKFLN